MDNLDIFHQLNDIWSSRFNVTLICVSALLVTFGLVPPIVAAWVQNRKLDKERERWDKDMERRLADFEKQRELIAQQEERIKRLRNNIRGAYIAAAQFYTNEYLSAYDDYKENPDEGKKRLTVTKLILYLHKALNSLICSKKRNCVIRGLRIFNRNYHSAFEETDLLRDIIKSYHDEFPAKDQYVRLKYLEKITGGEDSAYKEFVSKYKTSFDLFEEFYHPRPTDSTSSENRTQRKE